MWLVAPDTGMPVLTHTIREKRKGKTAVQIFTATFLETTLIQSKTIHIHVCVETLLHAPKIG